jgi:hypothetical protein
MSESRAVHLLTVRELPVIYGENLASFALAGLRYTQACRPERMRCGSASAIFVKTRRIRCPNQGEKIRDLALKSRSANAASLKLRLHLPQHFRQTPMLVQHRRARL